MDINRRLEKGETGIFLSRAHNVGASTISDIKKVVHTQMLLLKRLREKKREACAGRNL